MCVHTCLRVCTYVYCVCMYVCVPVYFHTQPSVFALSDTQFLLILPALIVLTWIMLAPSPCLPVIPCPPVRLLAPPIPHPLTQSLNLLSFFKDFFSWVLEILVDQTFLSVLKVWLQPWLP